MNLINEVKGCKTIAIAGHTRPDGDCAGSSMALYQYLYNLKDKLGIDKIKVYLENFSDDFKILKGVESITYLDKDIEYSLEQYDLFISLDSASLDRLGKAIPIFNNAKKTINIDHHISNTNFADINHVDTDASSTGEVLYDLFNKDKVDKDIATALYLSIIHDTGVFKHSNTRKNTMYTVGDLIEKGVEFNKLIDETFYQKTYIQNQMIGRALLGSKLLFDGKCIVYSLSKDLIDLYNLAPSDLDGVIDLMRQTQGVEIAVFIYELDTDVYKVSMRSNDKIDVSQIAMTFDGGGHKKAAGCTIEGTEFNVLDRLLQIIKGQLS